MVNEDGESQHEGECGNAAKSVVLVPWGGVGECKEGWELTTGRGALDGWDGCPFLVVAVLAMQFWRFHEK